MSNNPLEIFNATSGTPNSEIRCIFTDTNYCKLDFDCSDWNGASVLVSSKSKLDSAVFVSDPEDVITENNTRFLKW